MLKGHRNKSSPLPITLYPYAFSYPVLFSISKGEGVRVLSLISCHLCYPFTPCPKGIGVILA